MCVKQIEFVGHFSKDWEYFHDHFSKPPSVEGTHLQLYCKVGSVHVFPTKGLVLF